MSTVHQHDKLYICTVESCIASFARKDKLLKHKREEHVNLECLLNHSGSTILDGKEELHLRNDHGSLECGIGACLHGLASQFSEERLPKHLRKHHNIDWGHAWNITCMATRSAFKTARDYTVGSPPASQIDCHIYLKQTGTAHQLE